jgi:hypothetical protein
MFGGAIMPASRTGKAALGKVGHDAVQGSFGDAWVDAAQRIIGAKLDDHRIGGRVERPIKPGQSARARIARNASIQHAHIVPTLDQCGFQLGRKALAGRQAKAGGQTVAEREKGHRFGACGGRHQQESGQDDREFRHGAQERRYDFRGHVALEHGLGIPI